MQIANNHLADTKMKFKLCMSVVTALVLSACTEAGGGAGAIANLPENVVEIADPRQDLSSVRVLPEDGCYWYRHVGVVETTLLPLRTADGRTICTQPKT